MTIQEPLIKTATAFIDGQNLFNSAKEAFGYRCPNYDPVALVNTNVTLKPVHRHDGGYEYG